MNKRPILAAASIAVFLSLGACASDTAKRMGGAATTPLSDLNVVRSDIPPVLLQAQEQPYRAPAEPNCVAIALEIHSLDQVLGPDFDAPPLEEDASMTRRVTELANDQAVRAVQRTAEDLIPFRGWVRKLSGAERHSKRVSTAIAAGSARRAFLKGMAAAGNCLWRTLPQQAQQAARGD